MQVERRRLTDLKIILNNEREMLRKTFQSLESSYQNSSIIEETKKIIPSIFDQPESIPEISAEEVITYTGVTKEWIKELLGIDLSQSDLHIELVDGGLLCRLMNALRPGCIKKYYPNTKIKMLRLENIALFIAACEAELGLSPFQIFTANELMEGNMRKVLSVLIEIMKLSALSEMV